MHHQAQLAREVGSIHYSKEHDKSLSGIIPSPGQRSRDFILMLKRRISSPLSKTMRCDFNALCGRYRRRVHTFFFLANKRYGWWHLIHTKWWWWSSSPPSTEEFHQPCSILPASIYGAFLAWPSTEWGEKMVKICIKFTTAKEGFLKCMIAACKNALPEWAAIPTYWIILGICIILTCWHFEKWRG